MIVPTLRLGLGLRFPGPGPSFASTAAIIVPPTGPVFTTDFTALSSLPTGVSLSRATTATYFDASGVLQTAAIDAARFDHILSTLAATGLLDEEQRTNLFLQSNNFTNAAWSQTGTVVSSSGTAPDGVSPAYTFNMSSSLQSYVSQVVSFTAGISGAIFVYAKASASGGASNIRVTTNNTAAWTTGISTKTALTSQWKRVGTIGTLISSGTDAKIILGNVDETSSNDADCVGNVDIAFAQAEPGTFPTSYIPTTSAAVTRSADIPSASSPLTGYLAAGPSVWEFQDEATGTIARAAYAAGAFDWPVNKWYRSMGVYAAGTDTSSHMTVGGAY